MHDTDPDNLPPKLAERLADLDDRRVLVPRHVDEAILNEARRHLHGRSRRRSRWWIGTGSAVAAAVVLSVALWWPADSTPITAQGQDVDGNGTFNILDAMALARRVESGQSLEPRWDFSADGVVDRADADTLAQMLVALPGQEDAS